MKTIYFLCTTAYLLKARGEHTMKKTAAKGWVSGVRFAKSAQHYVQLRCVFTTFLLQTRIVFSCCTTVVMRTDRTCSLRCQRQIADIRSRASRGQHSTFRGLLVLAEIWAWLPEKGLGTA